MVVRVEDNKIVLNLQSGQEKALLKIAKGKDLSIGEYIQYILDEKTNKYELLYGYKFDMIEKKLIDSKNNEVVFTKMEQELFNYMFDNKERLVSYKDLIDEIWKEKRQDNALYSLRNLVKSVREKTFPEIVKNFSGRGYKFATY